MMTKRILHFTDRLIGPYTNKPFLARIHLCYTIATKRLKNSPFNRAASKVYRDAHPIGHEHVLFDKVGTKRKRAWLEGVDKEAAKWVRPYHVYGHVLGR